MSTRPSTSSADSVAVEIVDVDALAGDMLDKVQKYAQTSVDGTLNEYRLLEDLNGATAQRYADIKGVTTQVVERIKVLNDKRNIRLLCFEQFLPQMRSFDHISFKSRRLMLPVGDWRRLRTL